MSARPAPRGYSMLPVMLMVVALLLIASATLVVGSGARRSSSDARDHAQALALAELGLERTRAYLVRLSATEVDFDRALDPNLDSTCAVAGQLTVTAGGADDHLPPFNGPGVGPVAAGAAGRPWMRVPHGDGAYLVRIDDNEDDLSGTYPAATGNNSGAGCVEGPALAAAEQNPVRDRDRTVTITAVGLYPGTNPATARATRTLRAAVGPSRTAGIYAGGNVDMGGGSKACGEFADLATSGDMIDGCMCHAGCNAGPALNQCGTLGVSTCNVSAAGTCTASTGSGSCTAAATVPPPPRVAPFDPTNGPAPCSAAPCTPYYYLRHQAGVATRVYQWNYGGPGCQNPRAFQRLCHPTDGAPLAACAACWTQVYANLVAPYEVAMVDDPTRLALSPGAAVVGGGPLWTVTPGAATSTPGCSATGGGTDYPPPLTGFGLGVEEVPGTTFRLETAPPRGLWLVEGNMDTGGLTTGPCPGDGLPRSLNVVGSVLHETTDLTLVPAAPKGYVLLAGRDLKMITGNTVLSTCGTGAAVMVHEQFWADANIRLEAQLIAEHRAACSALVNGPDAIYTRGNMTIHVSGLPLVETGAPATPFLWSESAL